MIIFCAQPSRRQPSARAQAANLLPAARLAAPLPAAGQQRASKQEAPLIAGDLRAAGPIWLIGNPLQSCPARLGSAGHWSELERPPARALILGPPPAKARFLAAEQPILAAPLTRRPLTMTNGAARSAPGGAHSRREGLTVRQETVQVVPLFLKLTRPKVAEGDESVSRCSRARSPAWTCRCSCSADCRLAG